MVMGFEPMNEGFKIPCLSAWLHHKLLAGMAGLEPVTSWSQTKNSTKLSYIPKNALRNECKPQQK